MNAATDQRGQVGVETLIVFIAMILVAAIAAIMMITTVSSLQSTAETSSQDSQDQVTNQLLILSATGEVDTSAAEPRIDRVRLSVMAAPGASEIDLSGASIEYVGGDGVRNYGYEAMYGDSFEVIASADPDGTAPVLTSRDDRYTIAFDLDAGGRDTTLGTGESATLRIVGASGTETTWIVTAPHSLDRADDGDIVEL